MDPLTQGLLGAAVAELGFRRRIGPRATLVAFGAAMTPDLDMLPVRLARSAGFYYDSDIFARVHRGPTHSLLVVPLIALAIAFFWWLIRRRATKPRLLGPAPPVPSDRPRDASFLMLYACVFAAVLTHGLLDWCTSYGTQILWPLSGARYALDIMPIIDIIYTPILLVTVLGCWLVRKVWPLRRRPALAVGWIGFTLSMCYVAGGWIAHDRAVGLARDLTARNARIVRIDAYPTVGTIFLWRAVVECDDHWTAWRIHLLAPIERDGARSTSVRKEPDNQWARRARALKKVKQFEWFAMGRMRAEYTRTNGSHVVEFHDMRYGLSADGVKSLWSMRVQFDGAGSVVFAHRVRHARIKDRWALIKRLWRDVWRP